MSDTPTPEAGTLEGHIKDFVEMDLQIADLRATLAAKDRLLERAAHILELLSGTRPKTTGEMMAYDMALSIREALKETTPNPA